MKAIETGIDDLFVIEPTVYGDDRGFFFESYNKRIFNDIVGFDCEFMQDNHSKSSQGVLRGLHYQLKRPQGKLVRAIAGEIFDVAVDIRKESKTFGQWFGIRLSAENKKQLWVPKRFAHGFVVLSETAEVLYKASDFYDPANEFSIKWNDSDLNIKWPEMGVNPVLSEKDLAANSFKNAILE
ncbi:MAG: dTDP-4-dehydrorhamnose 3,5-epimerase [Kangiellaceae bacterium]|nr:dTDP-4-dehydrorhamnose 3,5-epimerase [Kangiellaceae bacterium]